uniref:Putative dehydrogenase with different specificities related to short-chain alcohol dehydrogenase n=1 Tax=Ixodes scapularis TaxID=6945 RepID=A0A4D5RPY2_IXOSC
MARYRPSRAMVVMSSIGVGVGCTVLFKELLGGCRYTGDEKLNGKNVIVTGSNTGLGKEAAREFAKRGANVIMACRDIKKCRRTRKELIEATKNTNIVCEELDLASLESVREFATRITANIGKVHILVNNAGVMRCPRTLTKEGFEKQLGVNHLGHFFLTLQLLDAIKAAAPSRIVNLSSVAHLRGQIKFNDLNSEQSYDPAEAYNQSKLANTLFTRELARKLEGTGVSTFAVHPGIVNTEINRHMGIASSFVATILVKPILWLFTKSPRQGAQTVIHCALAEGLEADSGAYFSNCKVAAANPIADDENVAKWLWATSLKWTGLS